MKLKTLVVALSVAVTAIFARLTPPPANAQDPSASAKTTMQSATDTSMLVGKPAPDFSLPDQNNKMHSLSDNRGKWVVLAFYPKDMTKG